MKRIIVFSAPRRDFPRFWQEVLALTREGYKTFKSKKSTVYYKELSK